jgi:hypothetical protein
MFLQAPRFIRAWRVSGVSRHATRKSFGFNPTYTYLFFQIRRYGRDKYFFVNASNRQSRLSFKTKKTRDKWGSEGQLTQAQNNPPQWPRRANHVPRPRQTATCKQVALQTTKLTNNVKTVMVSDSGKHRTHRGFKVKLRALGAFRHL